MRQKAVEIFKAMFKKEALFVIVLLSVALRFIAINQSLWLDEAIGAIVVKNFSYKDIITRFPLTDNHPPLYYLALKAWTDLYGYSEIALRSLSVLFGALTVIFIYKVAEVIGTTKKVIFPLLASLFLATSPLHINYSHEARMYVMAGFLATAGIYYFLKVTKEKGSIWQWLAFSLFYTALIFTDYVPIFLYPVFPIYALIKKKDKAWWGKFIAANVPLLVLGYFWYPIFDIQGQKGDWLLKTLPEWKRVAGGATFKEAALVWIKFIVGRISFVNKTFYYSMILVFSIPFAYLFNKALLREKKKLNIENLWFFVPLALGFIASFFLPIFKYFRFIFVLPTFYLILAKGVDRQKGFIAKWILVSLVMAINFISWFIYIVDDSQRRENWRQAVGFIEENAGENDVVIFENPEPFAPYQWYEEGKVEAVGVTDSISANEEATKKRVEDVIDGKSGIYYFPYLKDITDPNGHVISEVKDKGFVVKEEYSYEGLGQIKYFVRE